MGQWCQDQSKRNGRKAKGMVGRPREDKDNTETYEQILKARFQINTNK